jgi:hypothetical protein
MVEATPIPRTASTQSTRSTRSARSTTVTLVAILVGLNIADLLSTHLVLARGGIEGNPLVAPLISGLWAAAVLKGFVLVIIAVLAMRTPSIRLRIVLGAVDVWYLGVVAWNLLLLTRL